jgi:hypothetical protein
MYIDDIVASASTSVTYVSFLQYEVVWKLAFCIWIFFVFLGRIDLRPWLSSVSRKLKLIFGPRPQESATETIDLDVVALNMDSDSMQVSFVSNLFDMGIERI